jgi:hypothetical protein
MSDLQGSECPRRRKRVTGWVGTCSMRNWYRILADEVKGSHHLSVLNPVREITIKCILKGVKVCTGLKWLRLWL